MSKEDRSKMKVIAVVPAKESSLRAPNKNASLLEGLPLVVRMLRTLLRCPGIDEVWLDTESERIAGLAAGLPVRWMKRDPKLASNQTDGHALFYNEVTNIRADIYVQALCTSPFLTVSTIESAIAAVKSGEYDSAVAVRLEHQYVWEAGRPVYGDGPVPNSKDLPATHREGMNLYVVERETALRTRRRFGDKVKLISLSAIEAIDIDTPEDFEFARLVAAGLRERERAALPLHEAMLSTPLLADSMDEAGVVDGVVKGLYASWSGARCAGRAHTLKLRPLRPGESADGIYDALSSYDSVVPGDVIVVDNSACDYAYFGDLNARLAMRAGARGAIVHGLTRDSGKVRQLGFPVFARGGSSTDVRGRAVVEAIGGPLNIDGVTVNSGDFILADADGVCVVPQAVERQVLSACIARLGNESQIAADILRGDDAQHILSKRGAF